MTAFTQSTLTQPKFVRVLVPDYPGGLYDIFDLFEQRNTRAFPMKALALDRFPSDFPLPEGEFCFDAKRWSDFLFEVDPPPELELEALLDFLRFSFAGKGFVKEVQGPGTFHPRF